MSNVQKGKTLKIIIISCLTLLIILVPVIVNVAKKAEIKKAKQEILDSLEDYGDAYVSYLSDEPWFDAYMLELLPTLSDQEFIDTVDAMVTNPYHNYNVERLMTDKEMADLLIPKLLKLKAHEIRDYISSWDIFGYHNPYLLEGIQETLSADGKTLDELYDFVEDFESLLSWKDSEFCEYYKFTLSYSKKDFMEYVDLYQQPFYKEQGLGGYYDDQKDGSSSGSYVGNASYSRYYGDFYEHTQHSISFDSYYNVQNNINHSLYFRGTRIASSKHLDIDKFKYYTGQYLIYVDGNDISIVKIKGKSSSLYGGIVLE